MILNCAIIDEDPEALALLKHYVEETPSLNLIGAYHNAIEAVDGIHHSHLDILFLAIHMQQMNVKIIFTTAFKEYAIEAYKVNAFDYLVKPILYEDFMQTCQKVFDHYMQDDAYNPIKRDGFVVVKNESKYTRIPFENILFIESVKDYVKFHMADGRNIMTLGNLKRLEEKLPRQKFRRVHRSFIANLTNFDYIQNMKVVYGKLAVPISDTNRDDVVKFVEEHGIN